MTGQKSREIIKYKKKKKIIYILFFFIYFLFICIPQGMKRTQMLDHHFYCTYIQFFFFFEYVLQLRVLNFSSVQIIKNLIKEEY